MSNKYSSEKIMNGNVKTTVIPEILPRIKAFTHSAYKVPDRCENCDAKTGMHALWIGDGKNGTTLGWYCKKCLSITILDTVYNAVYDITTGGPMFSQFFMELYENPWEIEKTPLPALAAILAECVLIMQKIANTPACHAQLGVYARHRQMATVMQSLVYDAVH